MQNTRPDPKRDNAEDAGADGVIVVNNVPGGIFTMGGSDPSIHIPSVFIGQSDGDAIKLLPSPTATIRATLMRDGDVDSDIIWHEYGHGLTWRMIGSMNGDLSGAIGEGMSDVLSILINDDDVVGEYSTNDPIGIRSAPYTDYPRTYGDMLGEGQIHFDGEIYAATIWRLWELFQGIPISKDKLYDYLIGGMNFTPAGPAMEDMRDGILAAVDSLEDNGTTASEHKCLVWDAFAQFGIGDGAEGIARGGGPFGASLKSVTESFELPPECTGDNTAPGVTITSPADDITVTEDVDVVFAANATDLEDDDTSLTNSITWTSDLDGDIGITGAGGSTSGLSVGVHTITASVTDSGGLPGNYSVQVEVTGGGEPPPPPPPGSGMHIGDLDVMATTSQGSTWTATVQITVYDSGENLLAGAEVSVGWTGSGPGETVCTTIDGQCSVTHSGIHGKKTTLTVNNITLDGYTYDAAANHDPESDSDGTEITVSKP